MRICSLISHVLREIDSSIRDFVLCGLITAAENFSTNFRCQSPIRLLAILASNFFIRYDANLTKLLRQMPPTCPLKSTAELRSKIETIQYEWREFFGNSMSNYLMAWLFWINSTAANEKERFPKFFRIQLCKIVHNADQKLGLFKLIHNPASALFGQIGAR